MAEWEGDQLVTACSLPQPNALMLHDRRKEIKLEFHIVTHIEEAGGCDKSFIYFFTSFILVMQA